MKLLLVYRLPIPYKFINIDFNYTGSKFRVVTIDFYINFLTGLRGAWNIAILTKDFVERCIFSHEWTRIDTNKNNILYKRIVK